MIVLQNVSRSYPIGGSAVHALTEVNLEIARGEFVAIMGQSGSGKTTMMNIIGLLDRPNSGQYVFLGPRCCPTLGEPARPATGARIWVCVPVL